MEKKLFDYLTINKNYNIALTGSRAVLYYL